MATSLEQWIAENPGGAGALETLVVSPPDADSISTGQQGVWWGSSPTADAIISRLRVYYQPYGKGLPYTAGSSDDWYYITKGVQKFVSDPSYTPEQKTPAVLMSYIAGFMEPIGTWSYYETDRLGTPLGTITTRGPEPPAIEVILGDLLEVWELGVPPSAQTVEQADQPLLESLPEEVAGGEAAIEQGVMGTAPGQNVKGDLAFFVLAAVLVLVLFLAVPRIFKGVNV